MLILAIVIAVLLALITLLLAVAEAAIRLNDENSSEPIIHTWPV